MAMRMNRKFLYFVLVGMMLTLSACSSDDNDGPKIAHRTVVAYMLGESLETAINGNVFNMVRGSEQLTKDDNLLIYYDRPGYKTVLMRVAKGRRDTIMTYAGNNKSLDPKVMNEVLNKCYTEYPANSYGLVVASHGTGWIIRPDTFAVTRAVKVPKSSVGSDDGGKTINIPSMVEAMRGLPKLDFILWDCCEMQCTEVAYELRNVADVMLGSPAEIPGNGAPYNTIVPIMFSSRTDYREAMLKEYWDSYIRTGQDSVPLSMIKTQYMEQFAQATAKALKSFMPTAPMSADMSGQIFYFRDTRRGGDALMYDVNCFMLKHLSNGDVENSDYLEWKKAFDLVVPLKFRCSKWFSTLMTYNDFYGFSNFGKQDKYFGGMSMFVPASHYKTNNWDYNQEMRKMGWYYAVRWHDFNW